MEVRDGYQETELGVIPLDWKIKQLHEVGSFKNGINKSEQDFGFGFPFVNLMDVFGRNKIDSNSLQGLVNSSPDEQRMYELRKGDILFIRSSVKPAGVGLTALVCDDLPKTVYSGFLIRYRDYENLDFEFKAHCFNEEGFRKRIIEGSTISANTNINQNTLRQLKIAIPSTKVEQNVIGKALSDADALIRSLEKLIEKKRLIKQGAMQKLLAPKKGWDVKRLADIADFYSGGTPATSNPSYYGGNISWITSSDLNKGKIYSVAGKITQSGLDNSASKMVKKGTLLIALYGATSGVTAITYIDAAINQAVLAVIPKDINVKYLYYQLSAMKNKIISTYLQGGQGNLSGDIYKSLEITFPKHDEQNTIATILSDMDTELEALELKLEKYKMIKQGMMQNLLMGKIRLV